MKSSYDNGVLNGEYVFYNYNGTIDIRGFYKNGLKIGEWKFFDEKGILDTTITHNE